MELLKEYILNHGETIGTDIVKVDSFINHQIDTYLLEKIGQEIADLFKEKEITKIVTIETSGIPFACSAGQQLKHIPVVFAKKQKSAILANNCYSAEVYSFTKKQSSCIQIDKKYISKNDKILIIDDFLAVGNAAKGLIKIIKDAGAEVTGFCTIIEKRFQNGREKIQEEYPDVDVVSLASITEIKDGQVYFD